MAEENEETPPEKNSILDHLNRATDLCDGPNTPELINQSLAHSQLAIANILVEIMGTLDLLLASQTKEQ